MQFEILVCTRLRGGVLPTSVTHYLHKFCAEIVPHALISVQICGHSVICESNDSSFIFLLQLWLLWLQLTLALKMLSLTLAWMVLQLALAPKML